MNDMISANMVIFLQNVLTFTFENRTCSNAYHNFIYCSERFEAGIWPKWILQISSCTILRPTLPATQISRQSFIISFQLKVQTRVNVLMSRKSWQEWYELNTSPLLFCLLLSSLIFFHLYSDVLHWKKDTNNVLQI